MIQWGWIYELDKIFMININAQNVLFWVKGKKDCYGKPL